MQKAETLEDAHARREKKAGGGGGVSGGVVEAQAGQHPVCLLLLQDPCFQAKIKCCLHEICVPWSVAGANPPLVLRAGGIKWLAFGFRDNRLTAYSFVHLYICRRLSVQDQMPQSLADAMYVI